MSTNAAGPTGIVSVTTLVSPLASVTRSRTTWLPGAANDVPRMGPADANGPLPARSHAKPVSGLVASVELDTSETGARARGAAGTQVNDAAGGREGEPLAPLSENVPLALNATFPAASDRSARTV